MVKEKFTHSISRKPAVKGLSISFFQCASIYAEGIHYTIIPGEYYEPEAI
jgi:hypothetical protein